MISKELEYRFAEFRTAIKLGDTVYGREAREPVDAGILRLFRRVPCDAGPMAGQSSDCPRRDAVRRRAGGPARVHGRADRGAMGTAHEAGPAGQTAESAIPVLNGLLDHRRPAGRPDPRRLG